MFFLTSVVSDKILSISIQEPLLISKKFIVLLHTLSAYNSLLVRYKVYSTDPREFLCTSWRYAEAYENFSMDPAPFRKNPIKIIKNVILSAPTTREKIHWNKSVAAKISIGNVVRNVLRENKLWKKKLSQPFDNKSWYQKKSYLLSTELATSLLISLSETTANLLLSEQLARN